MGTRTFDHCLYARQSAEQMSLLDLIILYAAFFMLTVEIASDGNEQNLARRVFLYNSEIRSIAG
jgi:hypothetical protein